MPATELAVRHIGRPVPNAALLGAFAALGGQVSLAAVEAAIRSRFAGALAEGNVAAAREFYRRAAEMGWSPGALALGVTYDPLKSLGGRILGNADAKKAQCWYARARELADFETGSRSKN